MQFNPKTAISVSSNLFHTIPTFLLFELIYHSTAQLLVGRLESLVSPILH